MNFQEFVNKYDIKLVAYPIVNTNQSFPKSDAWAITLIRPVSAFADFLKEKQGLVNVMHTSFYMGSAYKGEQPKAHDVLCCLQSDATSVDSSFEDFCSGFGCDDDSISSLRTYRKCKKIGKKLKKFLGEHFDEFMNCIED